MAPENLTMNQIHAHDMDEHARRERLPMVREAYARLFRKDFMLFLELRAKELVPGGRMVVSLVGRPSNVRILQILSPLGNCSSDSKCHGFRGCDR